MRLTAQSSCVYGISAYRFQPSFLPEDEAPGLTPAVCLSITTRFQMNCSNEPAFANRKYGVAGLVRSFVDLKPLAAKCEHFRHERQIIQAAFFVKRRQDFFAAPDLHPIPDPEV